MRPLLRLAGAVEVLLQAAELAVELGKLGGLGLLIVHDLDELGLVRPELPKLAQLRLLGRHRTLGDEEKGAPAADCREHGDDRRPERGGRNARSHHPSPDALWFPGAPNDPQGAEVSPF